MMLTLTSTSHASRIHQLARLRRTVQPLAQLLRQLGEVISGLSDAQYTLKPVGNVDGSIGGHVRHCLDHVRAVIGALDSGAIDYDKRRRGTAVETSRCCGLAEIDELVAEITALLPDAMDRTLSMSVMMSSGEAPIEVTTTVGREMAFVLSHTVHHNALIAAMVRTLGGTLPERFGYAPATVRHLEQGACAR